MIRRSIIALLTGLLSLMLISCTSSTTIKEDTLKADILAYLNDFSDAKLDSLIGVKSIESFKDKKVFETQFDFSNTDASFSAEMTLTYEKENGVWKVSNHAFTLLLTNEIFDISATAAIPFLKEKQQIYFERRTISVLQPEYLNLVSTTKESLTSSILIYSYSISKLNWTFNETLTVQADYSYPDGWHYTMKDWSYSETSNWNGTWQVRFFNADGTLAQTIDDLVITGNLSYSNNMANNYEEDNTLLARFTYKGEHYSSYPQKRNMDNNVNGILISYGGPTSGKYIEIGVKTISGSNPGEITVYEYYATNEALEKGELTKIK